MESDYALAHAGKSIALSTGMLWGGLGPERMDEARDHAETAYKLLPENPVALYAMGMLTFRRARESAGSLDYVQRAVQLEPGNAMYQGVAGYLVANLGDAPGGVWISAFWQRACRRRTAVGVPVLHAWCGLYCQRTVRGSRSR